MRNSYQTPTIPLRGPLPTSSGPSNSTTPSSRNNPLPQQSPRTAASDPHSPRDNDDADKEEDVAKARVDWQQVWNTAMLRRSGKPSSANVKRYAKEKGNEEDWDDVDDEEEFHNASDSYPPSHSSGPAPLTSSKDPQPNNKNSHPPSALPIQKITPATPIPEVSETKKETEKDSDWKIILEDDTTEPCELLDGADVEDNWDLCDDLDKFRQRDEKKTWNERMRDFFEDERRKRGGGGERGDKG